MIILKVSSDGKVAQLRFSWEPGDMTPWVTETPEIVLKAVLGYRPEGTVPEVTWLEANYGPTIDLALREEDLAKGVPHARMALMNFRITAVSCFRRRMQGPPPYSFDIQYDWQGAKDGYGA